MFFNIHNAFIVKISRLHEKEIIFMLIVRYSFVIDTYEDIREFGVN